MLISRISASLKSTLIFYRCIRAMSSRTYKHAIEKLNSQQTNAATLNAIRASGGRINEFAIPEMLEYLARIGHTQEELNKLNVIHVTGTKGKGSTCAFCDSILRKALPSWKIGLYTSPHIISVRERIRINGLPISEEEFARYFFEVWDLLEKNDQTALSSTPPFPMYFRLVTLVAFHTFLSMNVDATILEVGVGGLYDSTNIVPRPIVTGVSSLGIDHVAVLGNTLAEIAYNKGGIFKEDVPALSVEQPEEGMAMLKQRASERKASEFIVVPEYPNISTLELGLAGAHQRQNASLAIQLAHTFLRRNPQIKNDISPIHFNDAVIKGLRSARWPGRCQQIQDPKTAGTRWFFDGSHTIESLTCGMEWFTKLGVGVDSQSSSKSTCRVLIFNCTSGRSGEKFLDTILRTIQRQLELQDIKAPSGAFFDSVIFCTNVTYADGGYKADFTSSSVHSTDLEKLTIQSELASAWKSLVPEFPSSNIHILPSIQDAVQVVRTLESHRDSTYVLVCGSLHLVGGVMEVAGLGEIALRA